MGDRLDPTDLWPDVQRIDGKNLHKNFGSTYTAVTLVLATKYSTSDLLLCIGNTVDPRLWPNRTLLFCSFLFCGRAPTVIFHVTLPRSEL